MADGSDSDSPRFILHIFKTINTALLLLAVLILVTVIVVNVVAFPLLLGLGPSSMSSAKAACLGLLLTALWMFAFGHGPSMSHA